jgi:hypothetical protein
MDKNNYYHESIRDKAWVMGWEGQPELTQFFFLKNQHNFVLTIFLKKNSWFWPMFYPESTHVLSRINSVF